MIAHTLFKTEAEYNAAVERTIELFDAQPGSADFDELELLLVLVKDYEDKHYQIPQPSQIRFIEALDKDFTGNNFILKINSKSYEITENEDKIGLTEMIKEMANKIISLKIKAHS